MGKYAIILVLALSFAVMMYTLTINSSIVTADMRSVDSHSHAQARNIAQSAAQVAVAKILSDSDEQFNPPVGSTFRFPADGVSFSSWADLQGEYRLEVENQDSLMILRAIGKYNDREYPVVVTMANDGSEGGGWPVLDMAVFVEESFHMSGGSRIHGNIGTNSVQNSAMYIDRWDLPADSAFVGVGGNPDAVVYTVGYPWNTEAQSMIRQNLDEERNYPLPHYPEFPDFGPNQGSISTNWPNIHIELDPNEFDNRYFDEIRVESSRQITFNVGSGHRRIRVRHLNISQGDININGTGTLTIYVDNQFTLGGGSRFNPGGDIDQAFMYYSGSHNVNIAEATLYNGGIYVENAQMNVGGSGGVTGHIVSGGPSIDVSGAATVNYSRVIYAPNAHVVLSGSGATGAVVSDRFTMSGGTFLYTDSYDSELPDLTFEDTGGGEGLRIASWN